MHLGVSCFSSELAGLALLVMGIVLGTSVDFLFCNEKDEQFDFFSLSFAFSDQTSAMLWTGAFLFSSLYFPKQSMLEKKKKKKEKKKKRWISIKHTVADSLSLCSLKDLALANQLFCKTKT